MTFKTELLIWRLDRRLRGAVPYPRRRDIRREVRANLAASTEDRGEAEAIRRLGTVEALAADYRDAAGRSEPSFRPDRGVRAALWAVAGLLILTTIRIPTAGMVETFDPYTDATRWEWGVRYLCQFHGDVGSQTLFEGSVYWTAFLLVGAAAFLVWSRAWRLLGCDEGDLK
jgi:hypothetical protein